MKKTSTLIIILLLLLTLAVFPFQVKVEASASSVWERNRTSSDGHFILYYNTTDPSTPTSDNDVTDEYVQWVEDALVYSWSTLIDGYGFTAPPRTTLPAPLKHIIPVYIKETPYEGIFYPDLTEIVDYLKELFFEDPKYSESVWYHIIVDARLLTRDSVNVTAAHEFFHAVQYGYSLSLMSKAHEWMTEGLATWAEDMVYDDVNDYSGWANLFLANPNRALTSLDYDAVLYWKFLGENYGGTMNGEQVPILKEVLEFTSSELGLLAGGTRAVDKALKAIDNSYSFESSFIEWTIWNYFKQRYEEGDLYDKIVPRDMNIPTTFSQQKPIEKYASEYVNLEPPALMTLAFDGDWLTNFVVRILKIKGATEEIETMSINWLKDGSLLISETCDGIIFVVTRLDDLLGDGTYTTTVSPAGWIRYGYDLARTTYYQYPSKYIISNTAFETLWSSPHEGKNLMALTGDVNGDGKLEVVKVSGDNLKVIGGTGTGLWTRTISGIDSYYGTGYLNLNMLEDVTGDGIPEIFVSRKTANTVGRIYAYDGNGNLLKTLTRTVGSDGNMWAVAAFDVNNDGNKEIFCGMGSNYVGNPRGACLFDYTTGNQLWYYAAGNAINDCVADLNNDGKMEITSGWWTVHNGASGSGKGGNTYTSDSSVYVVVINENGDEIFTWQVHNTHNHGGAFERIADQNKDGTKELIVFHGHEGSYPGYSQIFLLSPTGTILKTFTGSYNANWYSPAIADINKDGKDEIIAGCNDGVLRVFDYNLNVIASSNHYYAPQAANDLNGDGKLEIIVSDYSTRELVILDNNLNQLWKLSFPVAPTAIVSDVNGDGANDLIITADQLYVASTPATIKVPTPIFTPTINKISLRYEIKPVDTTFKPGINARVSIYDMSPRGSNVLLDLGQRTEDVFIGSFTFDAFKNRDSDPKITREEVAQNFYEAVPQMIIQKLSTYISKMHVVYSDLATVDFLFANFAIQVLQGTRPQATEAFSVLTFLLPVPLVEPTYVYSQYGYKLSGTWNKLGGGFGTGSLKTVSVYCYADLQITDSLGRIIGKTTNEIPGAYYFEADLDNDGELDDMIILPDAPGLEYTVRVIPEPGAPLDSTFTLMLGSNDIGIPIAENVKLSDAPESGYELTSLADPQETPPITTLTVGNPQYTNSTGDLFINSTTPLTLEANPGSADVASTAYRIYNSTYTKAVSCITPETFYLTGLDDGLYYVDYYSIDTAGSIENTHTRALNLDNSAPIVTDTNFKDIALQDGVTLELTVTDATETSSVALSIKCSQGDLVSSMEAVLSSDGKWKADFDTMLHPDGFYTAIVITTDALGNAGITNIPFSIRNWAAIELLPASETNKAGRTMPIKFSIKVKASVDPSQPFIYNEELTIKIYKKASPSNILLQTSTFGTGSTNYRIDPGRLYITNFKTLSTLATYRVEICRKGMLIGWFEFSTVK